MTEDQTTEPVIETPPEMLLEAPRRKRRWPRWLWRAGMAAVAFPILFAMIAVLMLFDREVTAPSWVKNRIEMQTAGLMSGGSVRFGDIKVTVQSDLHPRIRMTNIIFRDAEQRVLARVPQVEAQLSPRGLLFRRELLVQNVHLNGAQFTLRRASDGSVAVTFEAGETTREAVSFLALLDQFDSVFEAPPLEALREVTADGLIVNFEDARAGRSWTVDGGSLALDLTGSVVSLRGEAGILSGRPRVTTMNMTYESLRDSRQSVLAVTVKDAYATDIATQSPALSWLSVIDAPMSAAMRASVEADGSLGNVFASLAIEGGDLRPNGGVEPVPFEELSTHLTFHPGDQLLSFDRVSARTAWGSFDATGQAYLKEFTGDFPGALVSQLQVSNMTLDPAGFYDEPQRVETATVDFRMRLAPFSVDIGEFYARTEGEEIHASGTVDATPAGWSVAVDARSDRVTPERLIALWPKEFRIGTRNWIENNLAEGYAYDAGLAFRLRPDQRPDLGLSWQFSDMSIRYMPSFPPIEKAAGYVELARGHFTAVLAEGKVTAPTGGQVDAAGTVFHIGDLSRRPAQAEIDLKLDSTVTGGLALLDLPPFRFLTKANRPVTLADGRGETNVHIELPLKKGLQASDVSYTFASKLRNLRSDQLVEGHTVTANQLEVSGSPEGLSVHGGVRIGQVPANITWAKSFAPEEASRSSLTGTMELSQRTLDEFRIALPPEFVGGSGIANVDVALVADQPPELVLTSDLQGIDLSIPALSWAKPVNASGAFRLTGTLGQPAQIDGISVSAPGLDAAGRINLTEDGKFDRARFDTLSVNDWYDAPVEIISQGADSPVRLALRGGTVDLREAEFGEGGSEGGPLEVALDELVISDGMSLTNFLGSFQSAGGMTGTFTALMNGGTQVQGTVVPQNGGSAVRLRSGNAGALLASAGFLENTEGGSFDLALVPTGAKGTYDGTLQIGAIRIRRVPSVAALLNAVSVVGLLQQLDGPGIVFETVTANFRLTPDQVIVTQGAAVGASLGISLDGIYTLANKAMDFQGVLSPVYLLNGIGSVLTRPGEGLIGFNFTLRGTSDQPSVRVNPLSVLTPGMFRNIFRRPPPQLNQ